MSLVTRRDKGGSEVHVSNLHRHKGNYKDYAKEIPIERNTQELIKIVASSKKFALTKDDACYHLWCLAINDEKQKDEMLDLFLPGMLIKAIHSPNSSDAVRFNAIGCLQVLSQSDDGCEQIVETKVAQRTKNGVRVIAELMLGPHDRSKVAAAAVLYEMSAQYRRQMEVMHVLPLMLRMLDIEDPDWAGIKKAHAYIATAIRNLVLFCDDQKKENVKKQMLAVGVVPPLVDLLQKGPKEAATAALGTLRELVTMKPTMDAIIKCQGIEKISVVLSHGVDEQKALASGCILELTIHEEGKHVMVMQGILIPLVKVLTWGLQTLKETKSTLRRTKTGKKKGGKKKSGAGHPLKRDPALPPAVDLAVCNATGALLNLSLIDEVKVGIRECGALPLLVANLSSNNLLTQENVTGILWNMALEPSNLQFMLACNVPSHLISPLHHSWLTPVEKRATIYNTKQGLAMSKPFSAPSETDKSKQRRSDFVRFQSDKQMEFTRTGGDVYNPPRTPEEDKVRATTPPKMNLFGRPLRRSGVPQSYTNIN